MAARPYFTGNYGSPLMSNQAAAKLVADQGAKTGQMYAQMGKDIGGVVKQYGLNKEKRRKEEDTAIGALAGFTPEELMQIGQDNPKLGKAIERAPTEGATPRDFQIINASLAPIVAGKARRLAESAQETQNKMQKFNLGLQKKLEGTTIELAENEARHKATLTRLINMDEEDRIALGSLPVDQQIQVLRDDIDKRKEYTGTERGADEKKSAGLTIKGQKQALEGGKLQLKLNEQQLKSREQAQKIHDRMIEGMGGLDAYVQFEVAGRKLNHDKIRSSMELMAAQGKTLELNAVARVIAAGNIDLGKKYLDLHSQRGKLMDTTLTNPMGGGEITFSEYLKLNDAEGDNDYPLTGSNAGFAGTLNARYKALGLEMKQTIDATPVQVDDGSGGAGAQGQVGWMNMDGSHQKGETITLDAGIDDPWAGKQVEVVGFDTDKNRTLIKLLDDPNVWEGDVRQALSEGISLQQIYDREKNEKKREWMEQKYDVTPSSEPWIPGGEIPIGA